MIRSKNYLLEFTTSQFVLNQLVLKQSKVETLCCYTFYFYFVSIYFYPYVIEQ